MRAIYSRITAVAVCFALTACGSSSGNNSSQDSDDLAGDGSAELTGYLLAPRVAGLAVAGSSTDANGGFSYKSAEQLDFGLGSLEIASVSARSRFNLYDLVGTAEQYRFNKAVRLARVLISLDGDSDTRNGVQLSGVGASAGELDWQATDSLWQAAAESLTFNLGVGDRQLVAEDYALETMAHQFRAETETCAPGLPAASAASGDFAISDPSCADRARLLLWQDLYAAQLRLQSSLDQLFAEQLSVAQWWSTLLADWQGLLQRADETQAWLSYLLAGANVPARQTIVQALAADGAFSASLEMELERWRVGGGDLMRNRDKVERELAAHTLQAWLSYGFDQQALRTAYSLAGSSGGDLLINTVAQREGVSTASLRIAVVDQQVYLGLQLIDALMQSGEDWVIAGSSEIGDLSDDDGGGGDGQDGQDGQDGGTARVWRVSYGELNTGTTVEFTVEGSALDANLSLVLSACNNMQALSSSASSARFSCDLDGAAGGRSLQVIDSSDGSLLYEAIVSVVGNRDDDGGDTVVSSVSPQRAQRSSTQLFSVIGQNFPTDMLFTLVGCQDPQVQLRSSTQLDVLCQLDDRATVRAGRIEAGDGSEIYSFTVSPNAIDELAISVFDLTPAAALEAQTLDMVISGSGFSEDVQVQSSGCSSIAVLSSSDAEIRFSCRDAILGTWPVRVVSPQQSVVVPQTLQVRSLEAVVTGVTPLQGEQGEWVSIKIHGQFLSADVELDLAACSEIETLDSTAVLRQFGCTLGALGVHRGQVLAAGELLYGFDFSVEEKKASSDIEVAPSSSPYGEPLELRITGVDLPERAQLELPGCANIALLTVSPSEMLFTCTPQRVGVLSGSLVDSEAGLLTSFTVEIVDERDPLDGVVLESISPATTYLDAQTTFTVRGEHLPTSLVLSLEGCTTVLKLGGTARQRQFRCTPRGASGQRQVLIYASEGGALIGSSDLQVTGNELRVSDLSPVQTAIGVQTDFRVSGQNLSSTVVLDIEDCDARLHSASSAELRIYRCVPYGLQGTRTARVLDRAGGAVLYTQTIEMLPAP